MTGRPNLREAVGEYLTLRRALGFKLASAGRLLHQFVDYLHAQHATTVTVEQAVAWAVLRLSRHECGSFSVIVGSFVW